MDGDQLKVILDGLRRNDLLRDVRHLLTGYIGSKTFLRSVLQVLQTLKDDQKMKEGEEGNATNVVRYVCDPVLGDHGKLYVPEELVSVYREEVVPLADVVTPNQFEVELLTGISIRSLEDGIRACQVLHDLGPDLVIITSMSLDLDNSNGSNRNNTHSTSTTKDVQEKGETLTMLASERVRDESTGEVKHHNVWSIDTPRVPGRYTGTGDVCAALFLAWTAKIRNLKEILEKVASTMYALIKFTSEGSDGSIASRELKLIQSKGIIENPNIFFHAKKIET